jgi:threonine dehydrogenase-like Zn-dependent dehydrogenase
MRALLMVEPGRQEMDEIPVPEIAPGWALLRMVASSAGLFHTQMVKGMLDTGGMPRILGHEIIGEVVEARSPASPPPGTLVVADAVVGCGVCEWCIRGDESVCPWMRHLGIDLDGGFSEFATMPESNIFPLPAGIDLVESVMLSSALPASIHAVRRTGVRSGDVVLVSGVGSIGFSVCQVARAFGAATIVAVDVSDNQLDSVSEFVDHTANVAGMSPQEAAALVNELAGVSHGVDIAFETAGHIGSVETSIRSLRPGGTAMMMGIVDGVTSLTFQNYLAEFVRREIRLVTTFGYTRRDFLVGNRLYGAGRIDLSPLVGPTIGLEEVPETLAYIDEHGTGGKRYVVDIGMPA